MIFTAEIFLIKYITFGQIMIYLFKMKNGKLKMENECREDSLFVKQIFSPDCISDRNSLNASLDETFCLNTYVLI